jgi:hypothetical protein
MKCSAGEELGPQQVPWQGHIGAVQNGEHEVLLLGVTPAAFDKPFTAEMPD